MQEGTGGIDFEKIGQIALWVLGLYGASSVFNLKQSYIMAGVSQKITYQIRNDLTHKINKLPMKYFDKRTNGEVLSVITNDFDTLSMGLNQSITQIITSICTIIGILIMSLINIFVGSEEFSLGICIISVIVFVIYIAFDVQKVKQLYEQNALPEENLAIYGALQLYLDFINIFLDLLRIFGNRD